MYRANYAANHKKMDIGCVISEYYDVFWTMAPDLMVNDKTIAQVIEEYRQIQQDILDEAFD